MAKDKVAMKGYLPVAIKDVAEYVEFNLRLTSDKVTETDEEYKITIERVKGKKKP